MKTTTQKGFKKLPEIESEIYIDNHGTTMGIIQLPKQICAPPYAVRLPFPELKFIEGEFCK